MPSCTRARAHDTAGTPEQIAAVNVAAPSTCWTRRREPVHVTSTSPARRSSASTAAAISPSICRSTTTTRAGNAPLRPVEVRRRGSLRRLQRATGWPSVPLRPFMVLDDARYESSRALGRGPGRRVDELGARSLRRRPRRHRAVAGATADWFGRSRSVVRRPHGDDEVGGGGGPRLLPGVEWRGCTSLAKHGHGGLVDTSRAHDLLGSASQTRLASPLRRPVCQERRKRIGISSIRLSDPLVRRRKRIG